MEMVLSDVSSMYRAQDVYELRRFDLFTGHVLSVDEGYMYRAPDRARMKTFSFRLGV